MGVKLIFHKAAIIQSLFRAPPGVGLEGDHMPSSIFFAKSTIIHLYLKMESLINVSVGQLSLSVPKSHKRSKSELAQQATIVDDASGATIAEPLQ